MDFAIKQLLKWTERRMYNTRAERKANELQFQQIFPFHGSIDIWIQNKTFTD